MVWRLPRLSWTHGGKSGEKSVMVKGATQRAKFYLLDLLYCVIRVCATTVSAL